MNREIGEKILFDLYDTEADALFRFVSFRLADREKAKDIIQESYLRLWKVLCEKIPENPRAYLYRIARNQVIDEYRKTKEYSLDELMATGFDQETPSVVTPHERIDQQRAVEALREISENYREVLWLRFVEEWSVKDIAESLGISENVTSVRIHRGLKVWREKSNGSRSKKIV